MNVCVCVCVCVCVNVCAVCLDLSFADDICLLPAALATEREHANQRSPDNTYLDGHREAIHGKHRAERNANTRVRLGRGGGRTSPIVFTAGPISTEVRPLQLWKAPCVRAPPARERGGGEEGVAVCVERPASRAPVRMRHEKLVCSFV